MNFSASLANVRSGFIPGVARVVGVIFKWAGNPNVSLVNDGQASANSRFESMSGALSVQSATAAVARWIAGRLVSPINSGADSTAPRFGSLTGTSAVDSATTSISSVYTATAG